MRERGVSIESRSGNPIDERPFPTKIDLVTHISCFSQLSSSVKDNTNVQKAKKSVRELEDGDSQKSINPIA